MKPACRRIRKQGAVPIIALPRITVAPSPSKRRRPLTPGTLAKIVGRRAHKRPRAIVEEIAGRYNLNPEQQKTTTNHVIAMRAMQRRMSHDIRRRIPVRQTENNVAVFLDDLSVKLDEISTSDSADDFV